MRLLVPLLLCLFLLILPGTSLAVTQGDVDHAQQALADIMANISVTEGNIADLNGQLNECERNADTCSESTRDQYATALANEKANLDALRQAADAWYARLSDLMDELNQQKNSGN